MNIVEVGCHPDNYEVGRNGNKVDTIVLHIMDGTLIGTDAWFQAGIESRSSQIGSKASPSSAHYGIGHEGQIHRYVKEENVAYHAGPVYPVIPAWKLYNHRVSTNWRSIGIEHEGRPDSTGNLKTFAPEAQIDASAWLVADIAKRYGIPLDRDHIIKHSEVYGRKPFCPPLDFPIDEIILRAKAQLLQGVS